MGRDRWRKKRERGDDANGPTLLKERRNTKRSKRDQRAAEVVEQPEKANTAGAAEELDWAGLTGCYECKGKRKTYKIK